MGELRHALFGALMKSSCTSYTWARIKGCGRVDGYNERFPL